MQTEQHNGIVQDSEDRLTDRSTVDMQQAVNNAAQTSQQHAAMSRHLSLVSNHAPTQAAHADSGLHKPASALPFFVVAYQPVVDVSAGQTVAYEAMIRRSGFMPAGLTPPPLTRTTAMTPVDTEQFNAEQHQLDMQYRHKAIRQACDLGLHQRSAVRLSLAVLPDAIYHDDTGVGATLEMADALGFPRQRLIFDISEREYVRNPEQLRQVFAQHSSHRYQTAITDFGSGHSGLGLLADFQPDLVKLDRRLIRNLHNNFVRREIVGGIVRIAQRLGITVVAQGVESRQERDVLRDVGVHLMQGNLFAQAALERLPEPYNLED